MQVIKNRQIVEFDWQLIADDAEPASGPIIVSLARYLREREYLLRRNAGLGIKLEAADDLTLFAADLGELAIIALEVSKFSDGRCFSQARLLRERYGFGGDLLAVGDVLRDQIAFMERCGINVFSIRPDRAMADALKAFNEFSVTYQTAADGADPIYHRR